MYYNTLTNSSRKPKNLRKAFTLVEILIIIVLIGVLIGFAISKLGDTRERADLNFLRTSIGAIENGISRVVLTENTFPTIEGLTPEEKLSNILDVLSSKQIYVFDNLTDKNKFLTLATQSASQKAAVLATNLKVREGKPSGDPTAYEVLVLPATPSIVFPTPITLLLNDPANPNTAYADAGLINNGGSSELQVQVNSALNYYRTNGEFKNDAERLLVYGNLGLSNLTKDELDQLLSNATPEELSSLSNQLLTLLKNNNLGNLALSRSEAGDAFSNTLERGAESAAIIAGLDLSGAFPWDVLTSRGVNNVISLRSPDITSEMLPTLLSSLGLNQNLLTQDEFYNVPQFTADASRALAVLTDKFGSTPQFWQDLVDANFPIPAAGSLIDEFFNQPNMSRDLTVAVMDHYIKGLLTVPTGTTDFASALSSKLQLYFQAVNIDSDPPVPLTAQQSKNIADLIARHPSEYSPSVLNDASGLLDYSLITAADVNSVYEALLSAGASTDTIYDYSGFFIQASKTTALPPAFATDIYTRALDSVSNVPTSLVEALFRNDSLDSTQLQNLYNVALSAVADPDNQYQYYSIQGMLEGILGTTTFNDTQKLALLNAIPADTYETYDYLAKLNFSDPSNYTPILTELKNGATNSYVFPANTNDYTDADWDANDAAYRAYETLDALMYNPNIPVSSKQTVLTDLIATNGWGDSNLYYLAGANPGVLSASNVNSLVDFLEANPIADLNQDQVISGYANVISGLYDANSALTAQEKLAVISRLNASNVYLPPADLGGRPLTVNNIVSGLDPVDKAAALDLLWDYSSKSYSYEHTPDNAYYVSEYEPSRLVSILSQMTPQRAQTALNTTFPSSDNIDQFDTYGSLLRSAISTDPKISSTVSSIIYDKAFIALNDHYTNTGQFKTQLGTLSLASLLQEPEAKASTGFNTLINNVLTADPSNIAAYRSAAENPNGLSASTLTAVLTTAFDSGGYVDYNAINKLYASPQLVAPENTALLNTVISKIRTENDYSAAAVLFTNPTAVSAYASAVVDQYNLTDPFSSVSLYNNNRLPAVSSSDLGKLAATNPTIANNLFKTTTVNISTLLGSASQGQWDLSSPAIKTAFQNNVTSLINSARGAGLGASLAQTFGPYLSIEQIAQLLAP
jgi:type II secretory pathway pseudopilin PulG